MARVWVSSTFPRALHFAIQRHSNSSLVIFPVKSLYSKIYGCWRRERLVTGSVRAFESSSAKPMSWFDGVQEPRVLVAPDPGTGGNGPGQMILLRHPKSGNATQYLFANGMLQELQWFKNLYGSWFLGDYITEDGRLYLSTPIDPVFIMLPIFEEARMKKGDDLGRFRQLDEILFIDGYPGYMQLMSVVENCMQVVSEIKVRRSLLLPLAQDARPRSAPSALVASTRSGRSSSPLVASTRSGRSSSPLVASTSLRSAIMLLSFHRSAIVLCQVGSSKFFRLDDSKVLRWLCYKVCQLKQTLPNLDKNYAVQSEKDTLIDAVSILGEYLKEKPWLELLCNHLKLNILEVTGKVQVYAEGSNPGLCNELQEQRSEDKKATTVKKGRQAKKVKLETESHNIKDMFTRASRKKS